MTYNECLVEFMLAKLHHLKVINNPPYFTDKDAAAIRSWPEHEAKNVWAAIVHAVKNGGEGLSIWLCPFCIKHANDCNECEYGKRHGICSWHKYNADGVISDYYLIVNKLRDTNILFDNKFYRSVVQQITEEQKCLKT